jgi:hypothetical protein
LIGEALAVAARRLGGDRDGVLARLGGALGVEARAAVVRASTFDAGKQKLRRAEVAVLARAPLPPGLRGVHPTWIEAALAELPPRARTALANGGGDATDVWLARWATATFVAMPELRRGPPAHAGELVALSHEELAAYIARVGVAAIAPAFASDVVGRRQLAQRLPRPHGSIVAAELEAHVLP